MRFDLSDEEWAVIEPLLPLRVRGPVRVDDRKILNGIFYILRTGAPWRDLPERYGLQPLCSLGAARRLARYIRGSGPKQRG